MSERQSKARLTVKSTLKCIMQLLSFSINGSIKFCIECYDAAECQVKSSVLRIL